MKVRGQNPNAWRARWQQGNCPVHGLGLSASSEEDSSADASKGYEVFCSHEECELRAWQWPGKDRFHSRFGWVSGPEEVKAALVKASEIVEEGTSPGRYARDVRTAWPTGEDDEL
jgi:hypothetical protein